MQHGHYIVDMGLSVLESWLSADEQVQCLSYVLKTLNHIPNLLIPEGVEFELIAVTYLGRPYPCIGMFPTTSPASDEELTEVCSFSWTDF